MESREKIAAKARADIETAMRDRGDTWVIELTYKDEAGRRTRRAVSPVRWQSGYSFLAVCLCRAEPRLLRLQRCSDVELKRADDYLMPVPIIELESETCLSSQSSG